MNSVKDPNLSNFEIYWKTITFSLQRLLIYMLADVTMITCTAACVILILDHTIGAIVGGAIDAGLFRYISSFEAKTV